MIDTAQEAMLDRLTAILATTEVSEKDITSDPYIFEGLEQWATETIKWWEEDFPPEDLTSAQAFLDQNWDEVNLRDETAEVVHEFTRLIRHCYTDVYEK